MTEEGGLDGIETSSKPGKSLDEVKAMLLKMQTEPQQPKEMSPVKKLKVKSNHLRDQVLHVDNVLLIFDKSGVAEFPAVEIAKLERYMNLRPGRLTILREPVVEVELADRLEKARQSVDAFIKETDLNMDLPLDEEDEVEDDYCSLRGDDPVEASEPSEEDSTLPSSKDTQRRKPGRPRTKRKVYTNNKKTSK